MGQWEIYDWMRMQKKAVTSQTIQKALGLQLANVNTLLKMLRKYGLIRAEYVQNKGSGYYKYWVGDVDELVALREEVQGVSGEGSKGSGLVGGAKEKVGVRKGRPKGGLPVVVGDSEVAGGDYE